MNKLLEVKNLTTQFNVQNKKINAVNDISFSLASVPPGEIVVTGNFQCCAFTNFK